MIEPIYARARVQPYQGIAEGAARPRWGGDARARETTGKPASSCEAKRMARGSNERVGAAEACVAEGRQQAAWYAQGVGGERGGGRAEPACWWDGL